MRNAEPARSDIGIPTQLCCPLEMRHPLRAAPLLLLIFLGALSAQPHWKAGTAAFDITPQQPLWMAGYGARTNVAQGTAQPLWIKALALEDQRAQRGLILSTDTLGIPQSIHSNVTKRLQHELNLEPRQMMLHASHTHCGPVLRRALYDAYPIASPEIARIEQYSNQLEERIVSTVKEAFSRLAPATLFASSGQTRFAINRRNNLEEQVPTLIATQALKGPVDHAVPVLSVRDPRGVLKAVVFGYACHNTTLSFYQWCGDYAGFAQSTLEKSHPGALAMFFMGCGADQNPLPRRELRLAERYGNMLASAVEETLLGPQDNLEPELRSSMESIPLPLGPAPTREELKQMSAGPAGGTTRWASRLLAELEAGRSFPRHYDYPVQVWKLGARQWWFALGGEVVVDYALRFKKEHGESTWIAAYCNDVMAYIPSERVLREDMPPRANPRWGYEGNTSMYVYGFPAHRWAEGIEDRIAASIRRQTEALR
ncbi:MAG: hypothetical protein FJ404_10075 [Verrucomicrobia bacterium]|nr:hypothetical protein [Verrucomicrobiota bacterium]